MRRKLLYGLIIVFAAVISGANAYLLQAQYRKYQTVNSAAVATLSVTASSKIANAKQKAIVADKQGQQVSQGLYAFSELGHSKIDPKEFSAQLVVASNEALGANYVLADASDGVLSANKLTSGWTLQTINSDPMWAPGACSSKPTFFLQKHYIFIDDGKTLPTDKYDSYVVFDLLTQKFRYFGGDNFTDTQAQKEKILSTVDENDQIVFYIDPSDSQGPLSGSSSFKHSRANSAGYIIRRVIDPATLRYTDYHLNYTVPQDPAFAYYYVDIGSDSNELISITSDTSNTYYSGTVSNNAINLTPKSAAAAPESFLSSPPDSLATKLDPILVKTLPALVANGAGDANSGQDNSHKFDITVLGSQGTLQYLDISNQQSEFSTPAVYDTSTDMVAPMTTQAVFGYGSYVPLGVF